jgi:hypothetical protein
VKFKVEREAPFMSFSVVMKILMCRASEQGILDGFSLKVSGFLPAYFSQSSRILCVARAMTVLTDSRFES